MAQGNQQLSKAEFYTLMRGQVEFVNNIINQRIIWLVISQSFFFGGYAGVANAPEKARSPLFAQQGDLLLWVLPTAALLACVVSYSTIIAAVMDMPRLRKTFEKCCEKLDDQQEGLPDLEPPAGIRRVEKLATLIVPVIFMLTWLVILVTQYRHEDKGQQGGDAQQQQPAGQPGGGQPNQQGQPDQPGNEPDGGQGQQPGGEQGAQPNNGGQQNGQQGATPSGTSAPGNGPAQNKPQSNPQQQMQGWLHYPGGQPRISRC